MPQKTYLLTLKLNRTPSQNISFLNPITHGVFDHQLLTGGSSGPRQFYVSFANLLGLKWRWTLYPIKTKSKCEQTKKELGQKNLLLRNDKQKKTMFISGKNAQNSRELQFQCIPA